MYQDVEADSELGAVEARSLLGFFLKNPGRLIPLGKKYKLLKMPFHTVEKLSSPKANGEKNGIPATPFRKSSTDALSR